MTALRTKRYIGGYRVIAPVGAGGFATVYRAIDEESGREVAIKVLAENHSLVSDTRRRFLAEIDLLRTVDSQSIAQVYEVGETDTGQPYMVLELANRGDLRRRLEEIRGGHQALDRAELALLAHHLYESLTTLHRAEIVHRDVSPGNILIRCQQDANDPTTRISDGSVPLLEPGERFLLADLGHAKDMIRASGFTAGGGTRGFTSPEQRDDITVVDLRADIFSATAVIEWAAHDGPYADDLEPFFDIGLAEDPEDRFNSMTEWHAAFSAALSVSGNQSSRPPFSIEPIVEFASRRAKTLNRKSMLVAAAAVVLGGLAALMFAGIDSDDPGGRRSVAGVSAVAPGNADQTEQGEIQSSELLVVDSAEATVPSPPSLSVPGDLESSGSDGSQTSGSNTTVDSADTSETTQPSTSSTTDTTTSPTSTPETTDDNPNTSAEVGSSTTDGTDGNTSGSQPDADIELPGDGATLELGQELTISGTAANPMPASMIQLAVVDLTTRRYWNHEDERFSRQVARFDIEVEPGEDDSLSGTWEYTIPADQIKPGDYLIRVWAEGSDSRIDEGNDSHLVVVLP